MITLFYNHDGTNIEKKGEIIEMVIIEVYTKE